MYKYADILKLAAGAPAQLSQSVLADAANRISGYEGLVQLDYDHKAGKPVLYNGTYKTGTNPAFPVYDDKDWHNTWMPWSTERYEDWIKTVKGYPTIGYGNRYDLLTDDQRQHYIDSYGEPGIEWIQGLRNNAIQDNMAPVLARHPKFTTDFDDAQQASLASFYYNLGSGARGKETLEKAVHAGDVDGVYKALPMYTRSGGKVLQGLVNRRADEAKAFAPKPSQSQTEQPAQVQALKVQPGDSLWKLWKSNGNGLGWDQFQRGFAASNPHIADPGKLTVGTEYRLP